MNTFLDTNVIIGYIYSLDPLHTASQKAIVDENTKYYSFHVNEEIKEVSRRKDREYAKFLTKLEKIFNKYGDYDFIDLAEIHLKVNRFGQIGKFDVNDMHKAIDVIWNELNFDENTDAFKVKTDFKNYSMNFESKHRNGKKDCLKKMNFIPAHQNKDPNVLNVIHQKSLRNYFHGEDEDILFDANEFCKNNKDLKLIFVSADQNFIKAIDILMEYLCFDDCVNLIEFSNN